MSGSTRPEGRSAERTRELIEREHGRRDEAIPAGSFGAWLSSNREARNVSLVYIADISKISTRYLQALESDRFDVLPAPVFVRGFLREYARIVGLDPDEVVNLYLVASEGDRERQERAEKPDLAPAGRGPSIVGWGLLIAAVLLLLLGTAAAISFWMGQERPPEAGTSAVPTEDRPRPADGAAAADRGEGRSGSSRDQGLLPGEATDGEEPGVGGAPAAGEQEPLRVVLEFQQDCWVELVVDGRRRASELKAGGETWAIEAAESVLLTLGNAPAVRVVVDGRPVALPMLDSRVVREFRIDHELLRSGTDRRGPSGP